MGAERRAFASFKVAAASPGVIIFLCDGRFAQNDRKRGVGYERAHFFECFQNFCLRRLQPRELLIVFADGIGGGHDAPVAQMFQLGQF